jgi:cytochrome c oxidase cbb3-type subunit 3
MNRLFFAIALLLGLTLGSTSASAAADGEALFQSNCASCHKVDSRLVGPALKGVTSRWEKEEDIIRFVQNSQKVIQSGHPYANELFNKFNQMVMPPFNLKDEEVVAILDYIEADAAAETVAEAGGAAGTTGGNGGGTAELSESQSLTLKLILVGVGLLLTYVFYALSKVTGLVREAKFTRTNKDPEVEYEVTEDTRYIGILNLFRKPDAVKDAKMEGHSYDGIVEYDNNPPAWFNWLFFGSIGWAVVYLLVFHIFNIAPLMHEEYANEMQEAQAQQAKLAEKTLKNLDEMEVLTDQASLQEGKTIFNQNCASCHGQKLEGGVGPNLTDQAWLHGCSVQDIFMTIYDGVPSKGMLSWKKQLRPDEIQAVASYIIAKRGTDPANAKDPQGEPCSSGQTVDATH